MRKTHKNYTDEATLQEPTKTEKIRGEKKKGRKRNAILIPTSEL